MKFRIGDIIIHKASDCEYRIISTQDSYGSYVGTVAVLDPTTYRYNDGYPLSRTYYDFNSLNYFFNRKEIPSNYKIV